MKFLKSGPWLAAIGIWCASPAFSAQTRDADHQADQAMYTIWREGGGTSGKLVEDFRRFIYQPGYDAKALAERIESYLKDGGPASALVPVFAFSQIVNQGTLVVDHFQEVLDRVETSFTDPAAMRLTIAKAASGSHFKSPLVLDRLLKWYPDADGPLRAQLLTAVAWQYRDALAERSGYPEAFLQRVLADLEGEEINRNSAAHFLFNVKFERGKLPWFTTRALAISAKPFSPEFAFGRQGALLAWAESSALVDKFPPEVETALSSWPDEQLEAILAPLARVLSDKVALEKRYLQLWNDRPLNYESRLEVLGAILQEVPHPTFIASAKKLMEENAKDPDAHDGFIELLFESLLHTRLESDAPALKELCEAAFESGSPLAAERAIFAMQAWQVKDPELIARAVLSLKDPELARATRSRLVEVLRNGGLVTSEKEELLPSRFAQRNFSAMIVLASRLGDSPLARQLREYARDFHAREIAAPLCGRLFSEAP